MTRVLLVTGSRSLADDPAAERWARGLIREALDGVGLLIVGDTDLRRVDFHREGGAVALVFVPSEVSRG